MKGLGYMLEGRLLGLEEDEIQFISEDNEHFRIVSDSNISRYHNVVEKDIVEGYLFSNRYIKMFGCIYNGRYISCQGYVYSKYNVIPDNLTSLDRITFTGKAIDVFSGGSVNVIKPVYDKAVWERCAYFLEPKPWSEINTRYSAKIEDIAFDVGIDYSIFYNAEWSNRNIGTCIPKLYIEFKEAVSIEMIPKCYLWVFDFLKFISFRRNIKFDEISVYKRTEENKFEQTGVVHIGTLDRGEYTNTELNTILAEDIKDKFGELFQYIAERRQRDTSDELFIPDNDKAYKSVTHTSFLECALSFEGEYDRTQETKTNTNVKFQQVKQNVIDITISEACKLAGDDVKEKLLSNINESFQSSIEEMTEGQSGKAKKQIISYAKKILEDINNIDFSLEEQFNNVLKKKYTDILEPYRKSLATRMKITLVDNTNYGDIFAKMRNSIGHGHPKELEEVHVYTYQLARCMIYTMILDKAGISHEIIKSIIQKIFR